MTGYGAAFDWARRHVDAGRLPTAVLGIATADGTVALDAFGATAGRPARVDDPYWLFSITKVLTGLTAARAIERGVLTSETPLSDAIPAFGGARDDVVRLRHLVSHTSGIPEPSLDPPQGLRPALLAPGRDFAAGTASRYSTVAFDGIAALVRHTAGWGWDADISTWAAALGATGLTLDPSADPHTVVDAERLGLDMRGFAGHRNPGAGMIGTAADLLALGSALLRIGQGETGGLVQPATLAMMRRPLTTGLPRLEPYPAERGQDWGFTFNLRTRAPGLIDRDVFGHGGWAGTEFWVHPTAGVAFVLLTNQAERPGVDLDELDNALVAGR
ncbi:serine hydrolase domain-containing protein [Microbacterium sp. M3]|uniref:Serine hydrolase domain-containing protein n=1 Tax=Microbacterium arthrosphaerae TaxID=792652 RepID=A0ABU4H2D5_9MICO|nr:MULTISPECIES: serine hydrolase domain-containing protein [Microbacterium]MDW4572059.1 serine hydrolase domain-containing protein [Microbacterium arthrosphaerae]MDW7605914.1 serine hydrolase domain-containing protein [Microbacterium sp. M3]